MRIFPRKSHTDIAKEVSRILLTKLEPQFDAGDNPIENTNLKSQFENQIIDDVAEERYEDLVGRVSPYLQALGDDECELISQRQLRFFVYLFHA